jgi:poly-gamma-glutamate synthase PgsB/CapB
VWPACETHRMGATPTQIERRGRIPDRLEEAVRELVVVASCLGVVLLGLLIEILSVQFLQRAIPVRIVVMGTRGKSSVVRLIAFGLRAGGHRVAYKTTGSRPMVGQPGGEERRVRRRSAPTPLEQRRVLREAKRQRANVVVVEAMSVRPESLRVEVRTIVAPDVVVITNVRQDHIALVEDPASAFADAVPGNACVFATSDGPTGLRERLDRRGITLRLSEGDASDDQFLLLPYAEWQENLSLALDVCAYVGVPREVAAAGMRRVRPDIGALSAWRLDVDEAPWIVVNGFAANDPESTERVLRGALERWERHRTRRVGLLSLRRERGDRTWQWTQALGRGEWPFDRVVVVGCVPWTVQRRLRRVLGENLEVVPGKNLARILRSITSIEPSGGVLFGLGNMAGIGEKLVEYASRVGEAL